jgi:16S rRNA processing protein RimM
MNDYFFLGKITKAHGYEGKLNAWFDVDNPMDYSELDMVFVEINRNLIPYFIKSLSLLNNKAVIEFQDVNDADDAGSLVQKDLYLPMSALPEKTGNSFYFHEVEGFELIDQGYGRVGIIKTVLDYPSQSLFQVFTDDDIEVLMPMNGDIIQKVDRETKQILVKAPEGLIDIYLNK